jgi:hypothetical protein
LSDPRPTGAESDTRKFSEGGILVIGLLGGFAFAALIWVLPQSQQPHTTGLFAVMSNFGFTFAQVYFPILDVMLSCLALACVIASMGLLTVSSAVNPDSYSHLFDLSSRLVVYLVPLFAGVLFFMIFPYSPAAGFVFLGFALIIVYLYQYLWRSDVLTAKRSTKKAKTTSATKPDSEKSK